MYRLHRLAFAHPSTMKQLRRGRSKMKPLALLALLCLLGTGGIWLFRSQSEDKSPVVTQKVERAQFIFYVDVEGEIESSNNVEIRCQVKARNNSGTAILAVIPEGSLVEEGDWLVTLDASALNQELISQQISCNTSHAVMVQQENNFNTAEIAKREYLEGIYLQEEQEILREIFEAEESLRRAREYAAYSKRLAARGHVTALQLEGDLFAVAKAENNLDSAQTKLHVLQEITKVKRLSSLEADIVINKARWEAEENSYALEVAKLEEIEQQIENCTIRAPQAGEVVYAELEGWRGNEETSVQEGAVIRERQVIIRLPDYSQMHVNATVNESRVEHVQPGMPAIITVDAIDDLVLTGEVVKISDYPEEARWGSEGVKKYATQIKIHDPDNRLRPGLTTQVRIQVERVNNALQVPMVAIYEHSPKDYYCVVKKGDVWETRPIAIGSMNANFIVVTENLAEGEVVALSPRALIDASALPEIEDEFNPSPVLPEGTASASSREAPSSKPAAPNPEEVTRQAVDQIFSRMDKNSDGVITEDELPSGNRAEQTLKADTNGDKIISRSELALMIQSMQSGRRERSPEASSQGEDL